MRHTLRPSAELSLLGNAHGNPALIRTSVNLENLLYFKLEPRESM